MIEPDRPGRALGEDVIATLADTSKALNNLALSSATLHGDVRDMELARRKATRVNLGVLVVLVVLVAGLLVMVVQTYRTASETRKTNAAVADCTQPGGKCYEEGRTRTGGAVASINMAMVFGIECARLKPDESGPAFDAFVEQCVAAKMRALPSPRPSASPSVSPPR